MPKRSRSRSLARKGTLAAAAKQRSRQEDAQQRDSMLALARLAHSLASNLQVATIVVPSRFCHESTVVGALSKECRSSEARHRQASLLIYYVFASVYVVYSSKVSTMHATCSLSLAQKVW